MNTEVSYNKKEWPERCICLRNNILVWIEEHQFVKLETVLEDDIKFVNINNRLINKVDIVGIFKTEEAIHFSQNKKYTNIFPEKYLLANNKKNNE